MGLMLLQLIKLSHFINQLLVPQNDPLRSVRSRPLPILIKHLLSTHTCEVSNIYDFI